MSMIGINDSGLVTYMWMTPTQVDSNDAANSYKRWTAGAADEWIVRINTAANIITYGKAFGLWADRATLTYASITGGA